MGNTATSSEGSFIYPAEASCNFPLGPAHLGVTTGASINLGTGLGKRLYFVHPFAPPLRPFSSQQRLFSHPWTLSHG